MNGARADFFSVFGEEKIGLRNVFSELCSIFVETILCWGSALLVNFWTMSTIKLHDRVFVKSIPNEEISSKIKAVAEQINRDYAGKRPVLLGVLNGCFMFAAELLKNLNIECEISFVKLSSYQGTNSTGVVREVLGLTESITGRDVIIIEDIVDTGYTMQNMLETLGTREPASIEIASLFVKPARLKVPVDVKYSAFTIPDRFIVGFGLDYDGLGRNLPDIYDVEE